jgi:hypothetical protein
VGRYGGDDHRSPGSSAFGRAAGLGVVELALPALTVVSGLQLLRLMVSTVVGVYRDRFGAPLVNLACSPSWWSGSGSWPARPARYSAGGGSWW